MYMLIPLMKYIRDKCCWCLVVHTEDALSFLHIPYIHFQLLQILVPFQVHSPDDTFDDDASCRLTNTLQSIIEELSEKYSAYKPTHGVNDQVTYLFYE